MISHGMERNNLLYYDIVAFFISSTRQGNKQDGDKNIRNASEYINVNKFINIRSYLLWNGGGVWNVFCCLN